MTGGICFHNISDSRKKSSCDSRNRDSGVTYFAIKDMSG